jgi:hypothetical protein
VASEEDYGQTGPDLVPRYGDAIWGLIAPPVGGYFGIQSWYSWISVEVEFNNVLYLSLHQPVSLNVRREWASDTGCSLQGSLMMVIAVKPLSLPNPSTSGSHKMCFDASRGCQCRSSKKSSI